MAAPWLLLLLLAAPAAVQGSGCRAGARGAAAEGCGPAALLLEHSFETDDSVHFRKRGSLTWNVQDGTVSLTQRQLTEDERGRLRDVAALNGLYRVRVPRKPGTTEGPATAGHVSSFVPAVSPPGSPCLCRGRGWSPPVPCLGGPRPCLRRPLPARRFAPPPSPQAEAPPSPLKRMPGAGWGAPPDLPPWSLAPPTSQGAKGPQGAGPGPFTIPPFWGFPGANPTQPQWMYIVPIVLFLMMSGAPDAGGQGGGGGGGGGGSGR
ncbi:ER membrane protein complex subunit 10 [Sarcophilus harrisii]|uniref:ER membrane protein complex subunit 10 n=1 Tax=Sarcophilus harrisii TaxID=9305 RepID=UPI001301BF75|nr:ER membrane protein complex subunit 10 [Sarcophilus harrisii]